MTPPMTPMMRYACVPVLFALLQVTLAPAQTNGRYEEAKRMGMAFIQSEQFDRASGRLEEVWEQDQSDPNVGEFLALAYLNTEDRRALPKLEKQAYAIIRGLVTSGARVTFLVQHSHEKLGWLQGRELNQYCSGRLSLAGGHVVFVSDKGDKASQHSFDRDAGKIKSISLQPAGSQHSSFAPAFPAAEELCRRRKAEARSDPTTRSREVFGHLSTLRSTVKSPLSTGAS